MCRLTFHWMKEYVYQCLSASARGTQKTSDISQTRALHNTRGIEHVNQVIYGNNNAHEVLKVLVPAIL